MTLLRIYQVTLSQFKGTVISSKQGFAVISSKF